MSFKSVWGFDPDDVSNSTKPREQNPEILTNKHLASEQEAAGIPNEVWAQIDELWRIFER